MDALASADAWIALLSLTAMEIVLGIDNIVFISVLVSRLPKEQADRARRLGLTLALVFGALISPTDPVAVLAIIRRAAVPPALQALLAAAGSRRCARHGPAPSPAPTR